MASSSIVDRIRTLLSANEPFTYLTADERESLLADVSIEYFKPDEVILEQGTSRSKGLYLVESGLVRLRDVHAQRLISKVGEGHTFGVFGLLKSSGVAIYEATALEPTVCVVLGARRFLEIYKANEEFGAYFDQDLNQYVLRLGTNVDVPGAHLLFGQRLSRFSTRRPGQCTPDDPAQEAARRMTDAGGGPVLVIDGGRVVGVLTDRDLRARLVAEGRPPETPVRELMTAPVAMIDDQATLFDAMMAMLTERVNHLVLATSDGEALRILSDRDIAHFRGMDPIATVRRIDGVATPDDLADVRSEVSLLLARLYRQEVPPELLGRFLSALYDRISVRVLQLVEASLKDDPPVPPVDVPWAWLRLGSSGRQEMALTSEQHNAIVYRLAPNSPDAERAEAWFAVLGERVNRALEACGFAPSAIVARDPAWRMSLRDWKRQARTFVFETDAATLQQVLPFFDLRGIYGDLKLVDELKRDLEDALNVQMLDKDRNLMALLADPSLERRSPLAILRRLVPERFRDGGAPVNLREQGILPVVDAARLLALEARYLTSTNTYDRLRHAADTFPELNRQLEDVLEAYRNLVTFRLERQLRAAEEGSTPSNEIDPEQLTKYQRNFLRTALDQVATLQEHLAKRYAVK